MTTILKKDFAQLVILLHKVKQQSINYLKQLNGKATRQDRKYRPKFYRKKTQLDERNEFTQHIKGIAQMRAEVKNPTCVLRPTFVHWVNGSAGNPTFRHEPNIESNLK